MRNAESLFEYSATHPCHPTLPEIKDFNTFGKAHCLRSFALCCEFWFAMIKAGGALSAAFVLDFALN